MGKASEAQPFPTKNQGGAGGGTPLRKNAHWYQKELLINNIFSNHSQARTFSDELGNASYNYIWIDANTDIEEEIDMDTDIDINIEL